ncbi:hypothetical protein VZT92_017495 [Zoarces viviparus]|uniref:Uncharacterized protein n=1 Tax=Zoarces viviparus TaxID=48416 RepID=A0AAW1ER02_ZOAVI
MQQELLNRTDGKPTGSVLQSRSSRESSCNYSCEMRRRKVPVQRDDQRNTFHCDEFPKDEIKPRGGNSCSLFSADLQL